MSSTFACLSFHKRIEIVDPDLGRFAYDPDRTYNVPLEQAKQLIIDGHAIPSNVTVVGAKKGDHSAMRVLEELNALVPKPAPIPEPTPEPEPQPVAESVEAETVPQE